MHRTDDRGDRLIVDMKRVNYDVGGESWVLGIDMERTGERIKRLCSEKGMTVKELQKGLRIGSFQSIYAWFAGKCLPNLDNMYRLSRILGVPMDDIIVGLDRNAGFDYEITCLDVEFNVCRLEQYCKKVCGRWRSSKLL